MPITSSGTQETEIRERIDGLARALRAKDVDALMIHYEPDVLTFDLRPPLHVQGANAYRKNFEAWFASVDGPIGYEIRDLQISARDDVAFCHSVCHVRSTRMTGEKADYWVRVTSGLRKLNGRWLITHEHISVPIDLQTKQAAFDLQL